MTDRLKNKLIVSVQAQGNEPLNTPEHLLAMSQSVVNGGAGALRLCGIENIKHIKKNISVPIIGLTKLEPTPINWLDLPKNRGEIRTLSSAYSAITKPTPRDSRDGGQASIWPVRKMRGLCRSFWTCSPSG